MQQVFFSILIRKKSKKCFDLLAKSHKTLVCQYLKKARAKTLLSFFRSSKTLNTTVSESLHQETHPFHHRNNKNQCKVWVIEHVTLSVAKFQTWHQDYPRFTEFYWVLSSFIKFTKFLLLPFVLKKSFKTYTEFYQCLPSSKRYSYNVLP